MALKRLDEEFELRPGTQLLPYMKRLLPSLEGRFQDLEATDDVLKALADDIRAAAVLRMNEILLPATEDIVAVTKLGFLLAPITDVLYAMQLGYMGVYVDEGSQRNTFTPSPYLVVEGIDNADNYCIAKMISYDQKLGILEMEVTAIHGDPSAQPWMVSSTPGMAHSTKDYHDAIAPMHTEVEADTIEVRSLHQEIMAALAALEEAGVDLYNYVRHDGTTPFVAVQPGVTPITSSNDVSLATTAWARARIQEYVAASVAKSGSVMTGPLTLSGPPSQPMHAVSRQYIDDMLGGTTGALTITGSNPAIRLQTSGSQQDRTFEGLGVGGVPRWALVLGDSTPEGFATDDGSDFVLRRYSDMGTLIDVPLIVKRATGIINTLELNVEGPLAVRGDLDVYRPSAPGTGVIYMNQPRSAYHYFDGTAHHLRGGGMNTGDINVGHILCASINTQGNYLTTWGLTSHGAAQINGQMRASDIFIDSAGPIINMWDNDWGSMYIHHQSDLIGYLNNGGGWIHYITNAGHMWTAQYGWLHDYVNQTASNYAWDAANYRYNQLVSSMRWAYVGDLPTNWNGGNLGEPYGGSAITGWAAYDNYMSGATYFRFRQLQYCVAGGWYASYFA